MEQQKVFKVFYDQSGKLYKAEAPKSPGDSHMNFPTEDVLRALTEDPCTREEMISRINHPEFNRKDAVLAEENNEKVSS